MTTILWRNYRLYADSAIIKGTERYVSLTKIHALRQPLVVTSDKPEHCDTILGWVSAGAQEAAFGLIDMLMAKPKLHFVVSVYEMIGRQNLITMENYFEVILIGTKANYSIAPEVDRCEVKIYRHDQCFGLGTGGRIAVDYVMDDGMEPIRAMYGALYRDRQSGGMIDVWELKPGRRPSFQRLGLCNELPYEAIPPLLTRPKEKYPLDFIDQRQLFADLYTGIKRGPKGQAAPKKRVVPSSRKGKKS